MRTRNLIILLALLSAPVAAKDYFSLSQDCEEALALSALPAHLRGSAGAYVMGPEGYRLSRPAQGAFTCLVERNHPLSVIPVCYDAEGTAKILPAKRAAGEIILRGGTVIDIKSQFDAALQAGVYRPPARPGLAYMVSGHNLIAVGDEIRHVGPHLMFYAPNLADADIGGSFAAARVNRGLPFVLEHGIHGFAISFVDSPSDSAAVTQACRGQLPAEYLHPGQLSASD